MSRFADAPYFMLEDYINLVVAPPQNDVLGSDIVLLWEDVVFTDVVWVGGNTRLVSSSPYNDAPDFYPNYTDAQIFENNNGKATDDTVADVDVQFNAHWDTNTNASYFLSYEDSDALPSQVGVLMRGMEKSIIVKGGQYIDLFAKIDDEDNPLYGQYGFAPVRLKPVYETPRDNVYFRFDIVEVTTLNSDPTFTLTYDSDNAADEPFYDSDYIQYKTFDYSYSGASTNQNALQPTTEIYFRKDGAFHEWLKLHANEFYQTQYEVDFIIRNYVNTDKRFLYFGQIFPTAKDLPSDPDRYHIIFNGLKDWVQAALPANNRTDNLIAWNDTYFDMVHWEGYQLLKDIWSLRDANECDENFLPYIPTFYGIPLYNRLDDNFTPIYREYARDLVDLMKRKGTYASMYIIYDLFCNNNPNIFNVYERWHTTAISGNETIGEVDTEIELTNANFVAGGTNPETVNIIDGTNITFTMPVGTQSTATLENIVLSAETDITFRAQIRLGNEMPDNIGAVFGIYVNDGTRDIATIEAEGNTGSFSAGQWDMRIFDDAADGGVGDDRQPFMIAGETIQAGFNYDATTRTLTVDYEDIFAPDNPVVAVLRADIGTEWVIRFEGVNPIGANRSYTNYVELLYVDSGVVQTLGGVPTVDPTQYEDYIYTGLYGRTEPTDDITDVYGYIVSGEEFADPPTNSKPYYIDQNYEIIVASDGNGVIQENLMISGGSPVIDTSGNVYIIRNATTYKLYTIADVVVQPPDTDYDTYGYLYDNVTGAYVDDNGTLITYDGANPIFQSMLLLDNFGNPVVDGLDKNYIDLYPYVQKVPLQKALAFPQGAGEFWYAKSDTSTYPDGYVSSDDRMLSPFYRTDLDLNVKPITNTKILPRNVSENLYRNWEYMRPINRQAEYNYIYAPFTDLTGQSWSLYPYPDSGQSVTTALDNTTFDSDNFIYIERGNSDTWTIYHNLNTETVVMYAFDESFTRMIPSNARVIDANTVEFTFPEGVNGLGVVSRASEVIMTQNPTYPTVWRILHAFAREEVIMQFRFDADENVYYPDIVYVSDFDNNYAFVEDLVEPTSVFVQRGLTDGDLGLQDTIWYKTGSTWIIKTYPTIDNNFFNVNCYETSTNRRIEPRDVIFEDVGGEPQIRIEFDTPVDGFAAINDVGNVISFYGIIPRDAGGNMLPVDWRLEVQTETDIYTFLTEGSADAEKFSNTTKTIHYGMYISGTTDLEENDDDWWYYTFKVTKDSLAQLGIKDYDITGVELVNTRVGRVDKQRIIYSKMSGIWKPFETNFIGHIRIFKDLNGLNVQLIDALSDFLLDVDGDILTT